MKYYIIILSLIIIVGCSSGSVLNKSFIIEKDLGEFIYEETLESDGPCGLVNGEEEIYIKCYGATYQSEDKEIRVIVELVEDSKGVIDSFNYIYDQNPTLFTTVGNKLILTTPNGTNWYSGNYIIDLEGDVPEELLTAYLQRYPPSMLVDYTA